MLTIERSTICLRRVSPDLTLTAFKSQPIDMRGLLSTCEIQGFRARRKNRQMSGTTMSSGIGLGVKGLSGILPLHRERGSEGYELVEGRESDV